MDECLIFTCHFPNWWMTAKTTWYQGLFKLSWNDTQIPRAWWSTLMHTVDWRNGDSSLIKPLYRHREYGRHDKTRGHMNDTAIEQAWGLLSWLPLFCYYLLQEYQNTNYLSIITFMQSCLFSSCHHKSRVGASSNYQRHLKDWSNISPKWKVYPSELVTNWAITSCRPSIFIDTSRPIGVKSNILLSMLALEASDIKIIAIGNYKNKHITHDDDIKWKHFPR